LLGRVQGQQSASRAAFLNSHADASHSPPKNTVIGPVKPNPPKNAMTATATCAAAAAAIATAMPPARNRFATAPSAATPNTAK
jgi:hypothetical protein